MLQNSHRNTKRNFKRLTIAKLASIIFLVGTHLLLAQWFFPFSELLDDSPIINFDYPFHQQRSLDRAHFVAEGCKIWGYNPRLMAGYIDGVEPLNDGITHWINFISNGRFGDYGIYKFWTIFLFILPVILVPFAASLLGLKYQQATIGIIVTIVLLNCKEIRQFYLWGMGTFVFTNFISLLSICLFWAYSRDRRFSIFAWLLVVFPFSFLFHPLAFVLQVIGYLIVCGLRFRFFGLKGWLSIVALAAGTLTVNWHWIETYLRFNAYTTPEVNFFFQAHPTQLIVDLTDLRRLPLTLLILTGILGFWKLAREPQRKELLFVFGPVVLSLICLTYLGSYVGLKWLQPYRFNVSAPIFLIPFSALGIVFVSKRLRKHVDSRILFFCAIASVVGFVFLPHLFYSYAARSVDDKTREIKRITTYTSEELRWLMAWIVTNTDTRSRIAVQEVGSSAPIGGSHFIPILAKMIRREVIGGYHYKSHTIFGRCVVDENFVGIPFNDLNQSNLLEICDFYNIKTLVLHEEKSKLKMQQLRPTATKVAQHGRFMVFDINIKPSFFLGGDGDVFAGLNVMTVSQRNEPVTILKYHYFPFLRIIPDLKIECYATKYDPIGFIKVLNGNVTDFRIYLDYASYDNFRGRLEY